MYDKSWVKKYIYILIIESIIIEVIYIFTKKKK